MDHKRLKPPTTNLRYAPSSSVLQCTRKHVAVDDKNYQFHWNLLATLDSGFLRTRFFLVLLELQVGFHNVIQIAKLTSEEWFGRSRIHVIYFAVSSNSPIKSQEKSTGLTMKPVPHVTQAYIRIVIFEVPNG